MRSTSIILNSLSDKDLFSLNEHGVQEMGFVTDLFTSVYFARLIFFYSLLIVSNNGKVHPITGYQGPTG